MKYEVQYPSEYIYGLNGCIPTFILHTSSLILFKLRKCVT